MDKPRLLRNVERNLVHFIKGSEDEKNAKAILAAMDAMDRQWFVDSDTRAYVDTAMPIRTGQTISQPSTVARMLLLLKPGKGDAVLEAGAGSGWQAALLAWLVHPGRVVTLDLTGDAIALTRENLQKAKQNMETRPDVLDSVKAVEGNVFSHEGRYDRVIVTAGIAEGEEQEVKALARRLLKDRGRLVCPYRSGPLIVMDREGTDLVVGRTREHYMFVPLQK